MRAATAATAEMVEGEPVVAAARIGIEEVDAEASAGLARPSATPPSSPPTLCTAPSPPPPPRTPGSPTPPPTGCSSPCPAA